MESKVRSEALRYGGGDRGIFSTSTCPYLVVFYLYLTFSTSTDFVSTSTNLASTSTDHFLAVACPLVLQLPENTLCMIEIFRRGGVVDGEGGSSEGCLKWGGGGH